MMPNPVSKTAYYCTGVRMLDAESPASLLHDTWAARFMGDEGLAVFDRFREFSIANASNVVRHHIIDEIVRARLSANPRQRVVLLGAGFDARAFRLTGGEWFEVDEAPIIERKNAIAAVAEAVNPLTRIAIDFASESVESKLAPLATEASTLVIMEGVLYYLEPDAVATTLGALHRLFPRHELICDLQSDAFVKRWGRPIIRRVGEFGARLRFHPADPIAYIERLGYRLTSATSIAQRSAEMDRIPLPAWVIRWVLPSLRDGFRACTFDCAVP